MHFHSTTIYSGTKSVSELEVMTHNELVDTLEKQVCDYLLIKSQSGSSISMRELKEIFHKYKIKGGK